MDFFKITLYEGDPYMECVDIDECMTPELNTCTGGMFPYGVDIDLFTDNYEYGPYFLGNVSSDGYSQALLLLYILFTIGLFFDNLQHLFLFQYSKEILWEVVLN